MTKRLASTLLFTLWSLSLVGCDIPQDSDLRAKLEDDLGFTLSGGSNPGDIVGFDHGAPFRYMAAGACFDKPTIDTKVLRKGMGDHYMLGADDGATAINTLVAGNISPVLKAKNVRWVSVAFNSLSSESGFPDVREVFRKYERGEISGSCVSAAEKTLQTGACPIGFAVSSVITTKGANFQLIDESQQKMNVNQFIASLKQIDARFSAEGSYTITIEASGTLGLAELMYFNSSKSELFVRRSDLSPRCPQLR
jgi:hypothetical protein